jgi:hypothetical protein
MLPILLLLAATPQSAPSAPTVPTLQGATPQIAADIPVLGQVPVGCSTQTVLVRSSPVGADDLLWRDSGPAVGLHLLLDRRVGGCPAPLVVGYRRLGSTSPAAASEHSLSRRLAD